MRGNLTPTVEQTRTMTPKTRATIPIAVVMALAAAPLLTGCFGNPVHNIAKSASGGKVDVGGTSIPSDFPKSIPVYSGKVVSAAALGSGAKEIWNVSIQVPDPNALKDIQSALTKAGLTTQAEGNAGKVGASLIATGKTYSVAVLLAKDSHGFIANYTVSPDDDSN